MILNIFRSKTITIEDNKVTLRNGFYEIEDLQSNFDKLVVAAKLLGYKVRTFFARNRTGFFLIIEGHGEYIEMNFFVHGLVRKKVNSVHVYFKNSDYGIFHFGNQKGINGLLNEMIDAL